MAIAALDQRTAKFLTTAQVVTSVSTAVKELIENSIDAGASAVDVRLDDNGASLIEVSDDGQGIAKVDTPFMGLQSYTSKIGHFGDLDTLASYGFRGEALSSLCSVSEVTIITRTDQDEAARLYRMNRDGSIDSSELSHRSVGTTIQARNMFKDIPVRRQILIGGRQSSHDVKILENLLRSFGICHHALRMSYKVNGNIVFAKPATKDTKDNLAHIFGKKFVSQMDFIEKTYPECDARLTIPRKDATDFMDIFTSGQHIFINQRPISYKEIEKTVSGRLVEYFGEKIPSRKKLGFIINLTVTPSELDVNLEPNKTSVLLMNQSKILETLDKLLVKFYGIVEKKDETTAAKPSSRDNDSTAEYLDDTITEPKLSENSEDSSMKKRKIINFLSSAPSAAKRSGTFEIGENTPKKPRTAKKLFGTPSGRFTEKNKENCILNAMPSWKLRENVSSQVTSETISQLPVVDLGEDFSTQEILDLPNLDPVQVGAVLSGSSDDNHGFSTLGSMNMGAVTEEAWSRGQVPIKLHGGTDVEIYKNTIEDSVPEAEITVIDPQSTVCRGFSKFSKEMRPQIIRENSGINFVETAKMLTLRWKELSPEERGYYRDLAAADKVQQRNNEAIVESTKSAKRRITSEEADINKKKFLNMLDQMKNTKLGSKRDNLMMRTVVPWDVNREKLRDSFFDNKLNVNVKNSSIVIGGLNDNVWLVRTSCQIWALSLQQLYEGLGVENHDENENIRDTIEGLMQRWLREKEGLSLLHPVFEIGKKNSFP